MRTVSKTPAGTVTPAGVGSGAALRLNPPPLEVPPLDIPLPEDAVRPAAYDGAREGLEAALLPEVNVMLFTSESR